MSDHLTSDAVTADANRLTIDPRRPLLLNDPDHVLRICNGHVDVFAIETGAASGMRHHLFRLEAGDVVLDLHSACEASGERLHIVASGSQGAELIAIPRSDAGALDSVPGWISRLAALMTDPVPLDNIAELTDATKLQPGARCRGPKRDIMWARVAAGTATVLDFQPGLTAGDPPLPLTSGLWLEAGAQGCKLAADAAMPDAAVAWAGIARLHVAVIASLERTLTQQRSQQREQLARRAGLTQARTRDAFERLSEIVTRQTARSETEVDATDPLLSSCRIVADALGTTVTHASRANPTGRTFGDILEIARASGLRVRRVQLRDRWWNTDAGPLLAWHGPTYDPVALIRGGRRYTMIDPAQDGRRSVDRSVAHAIAPEAISFYKALPATPLRYRDLLTFAMGGMAGSMVRIALVIIAIGLLSLVSPLITNFLVNSVIPRTELDQLVICTAALCVTALSMASLQGMQGLVMLRLEGLLDYRLQAAIIDRLLRLPTSLFRDHTTGDLVSRAMGIEAARQVFTGRTLRGITSALFAIFSVGLMFYYDWKLGAIALLLTLVRAIAILATSAVRIYHEIRQFNLQGKVGGFVLQLISGVSKLRVASATTRALARWSGQFATQKRSFIASQRAGNVLGVFETAFPMLATLLIFALASYFKSTLLTDLGGFLGFLSAFGQATAAIGGWATSLSESLIAIPSITRMKPIIATAAEMTEDRRAPGELSGEIEFSGVTFRYIEGGAKVLDDITLRIPRGEYVAIVGPSGSGKSSLLRLLLGFERPEAGTIFYDGKALNTIEINAVRRQLGVVLQDTRLASGSLYDNICGGVELSQEQVWEAARLAAIDNDIRQMPMGLHTLVSEGVNTLSGGQRQRLLIARALARGPRILLFDEATSALDNQTQAVVGDSLQQLSITRIVIAHRLSTIRYADRIVMLSAGRIVQSGSYEELMSAGGPFAEFARRQLVG